MACDRHRDFYIAACRGRARARMAREKTLISNSKDIIKISAQMNKIPPAEVSGLRALALGLRTGPLDYRWLPLAASTGYGQIHWFYNMRGQIPWTTPPDPEGENIHPI